MTRSYIACACAGKYSAKDWVNAALAPCGGKGGGKAGRAQAAARDPTNAAQALEAAKGYASGR